MTDILERAHRVQREAAEEKQIWIKLAFLQDMITEIEHLRGIDNTKAGPLRIVREKAAERQEDKP